MSATRENKIRLIRSRLKNAFKMLSPCRVCPRECGVNRLKNEMGVCQSGFLPSVSSDNLHFGEEPPISGRQGSGTIFLTGCSLRCVFCQNYPISQLGHGNQVNLHGLAKMMIGLQKAGAHNINFVTPSHFTPQIIGALLIAYRQGLKLPIIYNCGGYESLEMIKLLDGIVDIYMPDMKYSDGKEAKKYSDAVDYPQINRETIREMARQVGELKLDETGVATSGLLIRHLVLPENIAGSRKILKFISKEISPRTAISFMSQYFPAHQAMNMPPMHRRITRAEYAEAKSELDLFGLINGWVQDTPP